MIILPWLVAAVVSLMPADPAPVPPPAPTVVPPVAPVSVPPPVQGPASVQVPFPLPVPFPAAVPVPPALGGPGPRPLVIGHRGACAYRPEHTMLSYEAAIRMGADYIEPDLVSTKDHVLVARHENEISQTTDVAAHPEFAGRRTTKVIDGRRLTGWFTEDFTLAELRTLRAKERLPALRPGSAAYDGRARVPTFDEVAALARRAGVGIYPETKHPGYFASIGLPLEGPLLATLGRYGWREKSDPVFVQSFETANLRAMRERTRLRLVQLMESSGAPRDLVASGDPRTYRDLATPQGLSEIASYADAIGVSTRLVVPMDRNAALGTPTTLVQDAHRAGLAVHVWTVRPENAELPAAFRAGDPAAPGYAAAHGDVSGWLRRLFDLGVDGVFTDDPGIARRTRDTGENRLPSCYTSASSSICRSSSA
ncbi:glycerophosphodiester phosphodiesterase [Sphaerisporangium corydalis]|uniref:glycerophosphodiester phosphodiesterase n=1 Tax=Sphaerisporangium corydalis TaxID=1441875 RepID=A0ABV9ELH2_9ACTN|nr:glycerophosphodiester phosphodiesterase [Sphaerisporangium corydalis]